MVVNEFFILRYGKATAMEMHERLVLARKRAGFETARDAAAALGVPYPTYAGHENGSSGFRADRGELYARRFKVNFEWLMRGKGPGPGEESPSLPTQETRRVSGSDEIRKMLEQIDGLTPKNITALLASIESFQDANAPRSSQSQTDDQSEPATPPRGEPSYR